MKLSHHAAESNILGLLGNIKGMRGIVPGSVVLPEADQNVIGGEVLVPGWVQDTVGCSEDPLITDQTGSTQQLLRSALVQHYLPANTEIVFRKRRLFLP